MGFGVAGSRSLVGEAAAGCLADRPYDTMKHVETYFQRMAKPRNDVAPEVPGTALFTIGHSTRPLEEFQGLLGTHAIRFLADVRRFPGSRKWPWFGKDSLEGALAAQGMTYRHFPDLGGRRKPAPDSPNGAWRVAHFQAFADYMGTPEFRESLDALLALIPEGRVAVMCAEALPWRCHRNLIADAVLARGIPVFHILGNASLRPHAFPDFARVERDAHPPRITYPPIGPSQAVLSL